MAGFGVRRTVSVRRRRKPADHSALAGPNVKEALYGWTRFRNRADAWKKTWAIEIPET